jgi:hypothetical protein
MLVKLKSLTNVEIARHLVKHYWCLSELPAPEDDRVLEFTQRQRKHLASEYADLVRAGRQDAQCRSVAAGS